MLSRPAPSKNHDCEKNGNDDQRNEPVGHGTYSCEQVAARRQDYMEKARACRAIIEKLCLQYLRSLYKITHCG